MMPPGGRGGMMAAPTGAGDSVSCQDPFADAQPMAGGGNNQFPRSMNSNMPPYSGSGGSGSGGMQNSMANNYGGYNRPPQSMGSGSGTYPTPGNMNQPGFNEPMSRNMSQGNLPDQPQQAPQQFSDPYRRTQPGMNQSEPGFPGNRGMPQVPPQQTGQGPPASQNPPQQGPPPAGPPQGPPQQPEGYGSQFGQSRSQMPGSSSGPGQFPFNSGFERERLVFLVW